MAGQRKYEMGPVSIATRLPVDISTAKRKTAITSVR